MDRTRVFEIIAAYGADTARWPAEERAAAQVLLAQDAGLRAYHDEAAALDADLAAWAASPMAANDVMATSAADAALAKAPTPRRWLPAAVLGGSIAASLMATVLVVPMQSDPTPTTQVAQQTQTQPVQTAQTLQDAQLWSTVFTPTPEEEALI